MFIDEVVIELSSGKGGDGAVHFRREKYITFDGMKGMNRIFQGAATVDSILRGDLIELTAEAGLRSMFVGFESLDLIFAQTEGISNH